MGHAQWGSWPDNQDRRQDRVRHAGFNVTKREERRQKSGKAKSSAFVVFSSSAYPHPGPIAFVRCMRTPPARSARHSATPVSACGSGPGRRTVARRAVAKSNQARHRGPPPGMGIQSSPIPSPGGRLPWRVAVGQFPGCSGGCRAGGAEAAALLLVARSRRCHHERCVALAHAYAGRTRAQRASGEDWCTV